MRARVCVCVYRHLTPLSPLPHRVFQKFPELSDDVCLYCKIMELLSTYSYSLAIRRFIQSKFERLPFSVVSGVAAVSG